MQNKSTLYLMYLSISLMFSKLEYLRCGISLLNISHNNVMLDRECLHWPFVSENHWSLEDSPHRLFCYFENQPVWSTVELLIIWDAKTWDDMRSAPWSFSTKKEKKSATTLSPAANVYVLLKSSEILPDSIGQAERWLGFGLQNFV